MSRSISRKSLGLEPRRGGQHWSSINFVNQGGYPITLTIDWLADFSANGGGLQGIPDVLHAYDGHHQVRQIQSIVTQ
jgi:hypothetical protein